MGFGEAIKTCFRKYFVFSGRAQRSEYWYFMLFTVLADFVLSLADLAIFGIDTNVDFAPLSDVFSLVVMIPSISACCRRLHDIGRSGWWQILPAAGLIAMIPAIFPALNGDFSSGILIGSLGIGALMCFALIILLIVWLCTDSDHGPNRFGDSPKYGSVADTFS